MSPDTIAHYLGIKVGDPYDPEKIRANFHALWEVGLLENVQIEAEREPAGVTLVVTIEERPIIKEVDFTGNKKLTTTQIRDVLKEAKVEVKAGAPLSLRDIARARAAIADAYLAQGFRSATVDYRIEDLSKTEKKVLFLIDEGDKVKIESITFTGNEHVSAQTLRNAMHKTKVAVFWRFLSDNTVYSQANYEADVESIKGVYQSKGYKDVVIKDPILDVYVVNPDAKPEKLKRRVRITIPIVEGDQFYTNEIRIIAVGQNGQPTESGQPQVFSARELLKALLGAEARHGPEPGPARRGPVQVETMYKSRGLHLLVRRTRSSRRSATTRSTSTSQIFEGEKFYLGRLEVQGNTQTRDKVIRREFALDEGDVMDMEAVKKSVTEDPAARLLQDERGAPVRASAPRRRRSTSSIKGQETSPQRDPVRRRLLRLRRVLRPVLLPDAQLPGPRRDHRGLGPAREGLQLLRPLVHDPVVHGQEPVGRRVALPPQRQLPVAGGAADRAARSSTARASALFDSVSLLYSYEDITANFPVRSAPTPPGQPPPPQKFTETTGTTSSFTPGYRYDSRNDPFDPTRGLRLSASVQIAPSLLGGTNSFIKPIGGGTIYLPVRIPRNALLAFNLEIGYVGRVQRRRDPDLRAVPARRRAEPARVPAGRRRARATRRPTRSSPTRSGGSSAATSSSSSTSSTSSSRSARRSCSPSSTSATTTTTPRASELGNVRSSAGAELRIFLPIFQAPLRFIYAFNLHPIQPVDQFGFPISYLTEKPSGFTFSIGRTF